MRNETVTVKQNDSARLEAFGLILSMRQVYGRRCDVVVGYPGLPNTAKDMETGDAMLFETLHEGVFEVRVLSQEFLVTQISSRPGLAGAFITSDPSNAPFTKEELEKIVHSIDAAKNQLRQQEIFLPEQVELLVRKLDGIREASTRLGRKDWINYVNGTITSICVSSAFSDKVREIVYGSLNTAFSWLFDSAVKLLS